MKTEFAHDKIRPFANSDMGKKEQVENMFDKIAGRYDLMNRLLSFNIDKIWRRKAINKFKSDAPKSLLDVACGTGDLSIMATKILQPEKIIGIDISNEMLEVGKRKIEELAYRRQENLSSIIELQQADAEAIPFADNSFDGIMVAFGVRNFANFEKGLKEMLRVLKPNAQLIILEFSTPKNKLIKAFYNFYMGKLSPNIARLFGSDFDAYKYLNRSTNHFPDREEITNLLTEAGYKNSFYQTLTLGICCIYEARK